MKKKNATRIVAMFMTVMMVVGVLPALPGMSSTVYAAEPSVMQFATVEELQSSFDLNGSTLATPQKVYFGQNGSGTAQTWYIAGKDASGGLVLMCDAKSPLATGQKFNSSTSEKSYDLAWGCTYASAPMQVNSNHYGGSELRTKLKELETNTAYFSTSELTKRQATTITTNDTKNTTTYTTTDKLYAAYGDYLTAYITVGTNAADSLNGGLRIELNSGQYGGEIFWLRSPRLGHDLDDFVCVAPSSSSVGKVNHYRVWADPAVVPAFNLNLSSVLFASAAPTASLGGAPLDSFKDCKVWLEKTDTTNRITMATLAQEESRKTSERVKAGQKISRDNGTLYGNGNILGYDRVGDTYVVNEEQAETVKMILDLYLQRNGSMKIAKILTERKRKNASGIIKWSISNAMRVIRNATYTGVKGYNKSRSNNFLEQKRINNLDMSTYEYVAGDFPEIVSQEVWDKAQKVRESRMKPSLVSKNKVTDSKRDSKDLWVNKLRCSCGSSFLKNKWHTKKDGAISYGYQCYNQLNNGRKESVLIAIDLIKRYYKDSRVYDGQCDSASLQAKIEKVKTRTTNLIAMRTDGEVTKEEYQTMRALLDNELEQLQSQLDSVEVEEQPQKGLKLDEIITTLNSMIDFSGTADVKATFTAEGRKNRAVIKLEEIEKISSLHRKENKDNAQLLKKPHVFAVLHRQQLL